MDDITKSKGFMLTIPLDASEIKDADTDQEVKVLAKDQKGAFHSQTVKMGRNKKAIVNLNFDSSPGPLHVFIGPANTSDEELEGLQTLGFQVPRRRWAGKRVLELPTLKISPYYWFWWRRWCRTFTIRGRVECPDGSPVPGAEVCTYDVDWWLVWHSTQMVACAITDIDGTFEMTFRWCCGWWPWWWWRHRIWQLDPFLVDRLNNLTKQVPDLKLSRIDHQPSLGIFSDLLENEALMAKRVLGPKDVQALPGLRERLLQELPKAPELERLRIWPWYPWYPWWDCTPDIIFKVTQDCETPGEVILQEGVGDTRWNIENPLDVTLVVADNACCRPLPCPNPPCEDEECLIIDQICHLASDEIGGNNAAPPAPEGYWNPSPIPPGPGTIDTKNHDRPFAGIIPVWKNPGDLFGVDYYEIEFDDGSGWDPLPPGAAVDFIRRYWDTASLSIKNVAFPFTDISGHHVVETREHYEAGSGLTWDVPGADAWWLSTNWNLLIPLDTTKFNDGAYRFRVIGWKESGGALVNPITPLPICGTQDPNELVLTFDNRVTNAAATHDPTHLCGGIHLCTTEPDTHIMAVRVNGTLVDPCDTVDMTPGGNLEVDFLAHDSDSHLAYYALYATWGLNQSQNLLSQPGSSVTLLSGGPTGWNPGQTTGNYGSALHQGAMAPHWAGGSFRLTVPMSEAFPEPCCYQLELWAFKRTIVGSRSGKTFTCHTGFIRAINGNKTEYSLGVGVCTPPQPEP